MKLDLKRSLAIGLLTVTLTQTPAAAIYIEGQTPVVTDPTAPMLMMATGLEVVPISAPIETAVPISAPVPIKAPASFYISGYQAIDYMRAIRLPQADWRAEQPELREANGRQEWVLRFQEERMIKIYWPDLVIAVDANTGRITSVDRHPYAERDVKGEAITAEAAQAAATKLLPTLAPGLRAMLSAGEQVDGTWQFTWSQKTREWGPYAKGGTIAVNAVTGLLTTFTVN